jgi:OOP family OmpA-OmpF porin
MTINQFAVRASVVSLIFFSTVTTRCQVSFTKTPALGINMTFIDFEGAGMKPGLALHFQNNLSRRFDYCITLAGSFLAAPDNKSSDTKQLLLENDFALRARLLKSPALFNPYVLAGAGWSQYDNRYNIYVPVGLGVQVNVTPDIFLLVNSQYRVAVTSSIPSHFFHSIGIAGAINRKKIAKITPVTLVAPVAKKVNPADTDGDGITDNLDSCPLIAGVVRYHGCPAPEEKPIINNNSNLSLEALRTIVDRAARQIFFETGSYRLLSRSFTSLDTVAHILKEDQALQLSIEGHTDNVGKKEDNKLLSDNRAKTVLEYLVGAGVEARRLQSAGYGQEHPIATNDTPEGRALNRRVVLQIHY